MKIDEIKSHKIFRHRLVIDFQYQSIGFIDWLGREVIEGEEAICGKNNITPQSDILFIRFSLIGPVPANIFPHDHAGKKLEFE